MRVHRRFSALYANKRIKRILLYVMLGCAFLAASVLAVVLLGRTGAAPADSIDDTPMPTHGDPTDAAPEATPTATPAATPDAQSQAEPAAQPLGKPIGQRQTRYEIAAALDEGQHRIGARMHLVYTNTTPDTLYELVFNLPANAFARAESPGSQNESQSYPNGFQKGGVIISDVSLNGTLCYFSLSVDQMQLQIPFLRELLPGQTTDVYIDFALDIPEKDSRYGRTELGYQLGNCFPLLAVYQDGGWKQDGYAPWGDPFYSETADYAVAFSYPEGYLLSASGSIVSEETKAGVRTSYIAGSNLREFACMLSRGMLHMEEQTGGVRLRAYALSDASAQRALALAREALQAFTPRLGEYPFGSLHIAQAELDNANGMEYPGFIMIRRELFLAGNEQMLAMTIAHEIAHQWFYAVVGNDQINAPWIDEAFAAWFGLLPLTLAGDDAIASPLPAYYLTERAAEGGRIDGTLHEYATEHAFANAVYWRGAAMMEALRLEIGDDAFYAAIRDYIQTYAYQIATKTDVVATFERVSEQALMDWFDAWLREPAGGLATPDAA